MKFKLLLIITFLLTIFTNAQDLNDEYIMGEWKVVNVDKPHLEGVSDKEALKLYKDYFLDSKFIFDDYNFLNIEANSLPDEKVMDLFLLNHKKWETQKDKIFLGSEGDKYPMDINFQKLGEKIYFILPMIRLEMIKLKDIESRKPIEIKAVEANPEVSYD